tara:strand:+ start:62 stop:454 length:393 start_codon:yes stop_codon:yes gene_type:complete
MIANSNIIHPIRKPIGIEPTSPKKILAGYQFQKRNPNNEKVIISKKVVINELLLNSKDWPIIKKIISDPKKVKILPAPVIPSIPSMKLVRLIIHTHNIIVNKISKEVGSIPWKTNPGSDKQFIPMVAAKI